MIQKLEHKYFPVASEILEVSLCSYQIEAKLIGYRHFPPLSESIWEIISNKNIFYGYILDDRISGVIEFEWAKENCTINRLTVLPQYFRQGIASKLLSFLIKPSMTYKVMTAEKNIPAYSLYKKYGFKKISTCIAKDSDITLVNLERTIE